MKSLSEEHWHLIEAIHRFVDEYAKISPNYDPEFDEEDDKYTCPDAYQLLGAAKALEENRIPQSCWSEFGCGGYKNWNDKKVKTLHDSLVSEVYAIINSKS